MTGRIYEALTSNTSLSGAMILAEKIEYKFKENYNLEIDTQLSFGITQATDTDTYESIIEKLEDALGRAKNNRDKRRIEIET